MYIVIAILAFGVIIAVHELGHYLSAKALKVKVYEFAIGMGPKILKKQGKETLYSLRAFPLGGFCAMESPDEDPEDPRCFLSQKRWRRIIILSAGSAANLIAAFIIIVILTAGVDIFVGTTITGLADGFPNRGSDGLLPGDRIVSINGDRLYYIDDFSLFMQLNAGSNVDLVIEREGNKIKLNDFPLERRVYNIDGTERLRYGLTFNVIEATALEQFKYSCYQSYNFIRLIRVSLLMLASGDAGVNEISGFVGIVDAMNTIGKESPNTVTAIGNIAFFMAFIGVNVAVVNMLPIPAMDGGRILFTFISWVIEKIIRRKLDPKYEGYINTGAFILLIGLMVFILYNDIARIIASRIANG